MNEKYSFILNRKNIKEGKIYIVEYSSTKKSLKIFPEKQSILAIFDGLI